MPKIELLSDRRTPTCPNCGMAKLEAEDTIWTEEGGTDECPTLIELVIGVCPNCDYTFDYKQFYTHEPIGYEIVSDYTEDKEDEE